MADKKFNPHIRGLIFGSLIGDAMGIQFEFYEKNLINIPDNLTYKKSHFLPIEACNWSDDGDNIILLLDTIIESRFTEQCICKKIDYFLYARKLKNWLINGIPELGTTTGIGCGNTIYTVVNHPDFETDPHKSSNEIFLKTKSSSNGAIMKISAISLSSNDENIVIENTINVCKVTHSSPLAISSCIAINIILYRIIHNKFSPFNINEVEATINKIISKILKMSLLKGDEIKEFIKHIRFDHIESIKLDEEFKVGYTLKTMACAFWVLRNNIIGYEKLLKKIYSQGGDTDTNGCVAGAVAGCILGVYSLPINWFNDLKNKDFVDEKIKKIELLF